MILTSIKMQAFRQYLNPIEIDFSKDKEKNITLIMAANGVGKTTMLQAFRYCFYGQRSAYFNLPKTDELINNKLHKEIKEGQSVPMFVEVTFEHKNTSYIARREIKYAKRNNKISAYGNEMFTLKYLTTHDGWKTYDENDSYNKMHQILPDGLSQVFMFDGERMERNISETKFRNELKDSILGILGIKKYDRLIDIIGTEGRKNSILGVLNARITSSSKEDRRMIDQYQKALESKNDKEEKLEILNDEVSEIEVELEKLSIIQKEIDENKLNVSKRDAQLEIHKKAEFELKYLAEQYLNLINKTLIYKMMLEKKKQYDDFINQHATSDLFYEQLHIHTLDAILDKGTCLCGNHIKSHSKEEKRLNDLKAYALPIEAAQNLNLIAQKYKIAVEYKELFQQINRIKEQMVVKKVEISKIKIKITSLSRQIQEIEKKYHVDTQIQYENLVNKKEQIIKEIGSVEKEIGLVNRILDKTKNAMARIEKENLSNQRVNQLKEVFKRIKNKLEAFRDEKDRFARGVLTEAFEKSISQTLQGEYEASIDDKYRIKIIDKNSQTDVTKVLSTGQNVVIQLSFMNALITTAKKLSKDMDITEDYGVIMDAALSNLDEKHIKNICEYNLINLDQLIFLSFKKQLRNEMYNGIKNNIGIAYLLERNQKGNIVHQRVDNGNVDKIIHSKVGEDDE